MDKFKLLGSINYLLIEGEVRFHATLLSMQRTQGTVPSAVVEKGVDAIRAYANSHVVVFQCECAEAERRAKEERRRRRARSNEVFTVRCGSHRLTCSLAYEESELGSEFIRVSIEEPLRFAEHYCFSEMRRAGKGFFDENDVLNDWVRVYAREAIPSLYERACKRLRWPELTRVVEELNRS